MRPRWRNTLWLLFAATCGATGFYLGIGKGVQVIASLSNSLQRSDAFADIRLALPIVTQEPQGVAADYAEANLRNAIFRLGSLTYVEHLDCSTRDRAQLARAVAWLAKRPRHAEDVRDQVFMRGVAACRRPVPIQAEPGV
jgi:hypothetical protein